MIRSDFVDLVQRFVAVVLFLVAAFAVITHCAGCGPDVGRVYTAVEIAEWTLPYSHALDACRESARVSGSWRVYEACERAETRKVCNQRPGLRAAWPRCLEVEQ